MHVQWNIHKKRSKWKVNFFYQRSVLAILEILSVGDCVNRLLIYFYLIWENLIFCMKFLVLIMEFFSQIFVNNSVWLCFKFRFGFIFGTLFGFIFRLLLISDWFEFRFLLLVYFPIKNLVQIQIMIYIVSVFDLVS